MSRPRHALLLVLLVVAGLAASASAAPAAAPEVWRNHVTSWSPVAAIQSTGQDEWRTEHPSVSGRFRVGTSISCDPGSRICATNQEELQAHCASARECTLVAPRDEIRDHVPYRVERGPLNWIVRDRHGSRLGRVSRLGYGYPSGAVALLASAAILCPEATSAPVGCRDPRTEVFRRQRAAEQGRSDLVPLGTHGLVWRHHVLAWNFVAQVQIDGQDAGETDWRVMHTHPDGIGPDTVGIDSTIVCRDGDERACTMSGPAVTDLKASCSRADRCELATGGSTLRPKVPAYAQRGPLNWIVRDAKGDRLGRVAKLGKGYPNGAVALLAATTMLCPEAAASYVGCPSPLAAPGGSGFARRR